MSIDEQAVSSGRHRVSPQGAGGFALGGEDDAEKAAGLRRMKIVATGFLVAAAAVYLLCRFLEHRGGGAGAWVGYVRAASEAGMVGALADWFAVTALFRHPLGIPIPHTALIRKKKDQIGDSLADFVKGNFLTADVVAAKAAELDLPRRVSAWVADPAHRDRVDDEAARVVRLASEMVRDEDIERLVQSGLRWLGEPQWAPPIGRVLESVQRDGRLLPLVDVFCERAYRWAVDAGPLIDRLIEKDAPNWAPRFVNVLVGDKIHRELVEFTWRVHSDPQHEVRRAIDELIATFAADLQRDPETIASFEEVKTELLARDEVTDATSTAWRSARDILVEALEDRNSTLRVTIAESVVNVAARVQAEPALLTKLNAWTVRMARHVAENYSDEIISIITETVQGWDADEAGRKIELQVGRDLQFIRINGTVVGALAGLTIYTASELLFG